jgi:hypothetical protein
MDWNTVLLVAKTLGVVMVVLEGVVLYSTGKFLWLTMKRK